MRPQETRYRLFDAKEDAQKMRVFLGQEKGRPKEWGWPTVVAERNENIVGVISAKANEDGIQVGPMMVSPNVSGITALRLIEAIDNVFRLAGVTQYLFSVERDNERYLSMVERLGFRPYYQSKSRKWYVRNINEQSNS